MNNTIIDKDDKIEIPQNKKSKYSIKIDEEWKYSIKISFDYTEEINYFNLFLIIKSYVNNEELPPYAICTSLLLDKKIVITQKENLIWFKKIDYYAFTEWLDFRIAHDSKYDTNTQFYGISLLYSRNLCKTEQNDDYCLKYLKPVYPWKPEWLVFFKNQINKITLLEEELNYYKNKK